jgi:hypothetical protein
METDSILITLKARNTWKGRFKLRIRLRTRNRLCPHGLASRNKLHDTRCNASRASYWDDVSRNLNWTLDNTAVDEIFVNSPAVFYLRVFMQSQDVDNATNLFGPRCFQIKLLTLFPRHYWSEIRSESVAERSHNAAAWKCESLNCLSRETKFSINPPINVILLAEKIGPGNCAPAQNESWEHFRNNERSAVSSIARRQQRKEMILANV